MSSMPVTGVRLVAQDSAAFMKAMADASAAVEKFNATVASSAKGAMPAMTSAAAQGQKAMGGLTFQSLVGANVFGNILTQGINAAASAFTGFISTSVNAVGGLQDMTINLETLAAREILTAGTTDSMTEAMKLGKDTAAAMMQELKKLSIQSPFRQEQVMDVFQMNMAFGQSSDMALKLTGAILNMGSIMQNVPGVLQRLSYNFSQMALVGKITARDMKDLRQAGLDLDKVLGKQLGKTVAEVNAEMAAGTMTFEQVSQALVDYTDKYIGPAAQRASRSLKGLISTFSDVSFFAAGNLFLSAGNRISDALGQVLDSVVAFVNSPVFTAAGAGIDFFTAKMIEGFSVISGGWLKTLEQSEAIQAASAASKEKALAGEIDAVAEANAKIQAAQETAMQQQADIWIETAGSAAGWGANVIANFASGFINAAATVLVEAMNFVASMLSFWLAPGSPPRVAPNVDSWGASTINEYLKGFSEADFSLVDAISGPLKNALALATDMGMLGEGGADAALASIIKGTIAAASGAGSMGDVLDQIRSTAGPFADEIAKLAEQQFNLAAATKEAEEWQEKLNDAQKRAFTASQKVASGIKEYNKMLKEGASKDALKAKLAEINAARLEQKTATEEGGVAAKNINAAEENMAAIKEQISLQSKLIDQLTELAQLHKLEGEKGGGGGGGGGGAPAIPKGGGGGGKPPEISKIFEDMRSKIAAEAMTAFKPLTDVFNNQARPAFMRVKMAWDEMTQAFSRAWMANVVPVIIAIREWWASLPVMEGMQAFSDRAVQNLGAIAAGFALVVVGGLVLQGVFAGLAVVGGVIAAVLASPLLPIALLIGAIALLTAAWDTNLGGIRDKTISVMGAIADNIGNFSTWMHQTWADMNTAVATGISDMIAKIDQMITDIQTNLNGMADAMYSIGSNMIQGLIDGAMSLGSAVTDAIREMVERAVAAAKAALGISSPSRVFIDIGENTSAGMAEGVKQTAEIPAQQVQHMANKVARAAITPPAEARHMARSAPAPQGRPGVTVTIGDVYISDPQEGEIFQARVEQAVMNALLGAA